MLKQNTFSRVLANESKLGAYYTNTDHAYRLGRLLKIPDKACVLEPSVGDASALTAFLKGSGAKETVTYGVELNTETYNEVKEKLSYCLNADFVNGMNLSKRAFSFCFANPPYGEVGERHERLEKKFVERIYNALAIDGLMCLVVSFPTMQISDFVRSLIDRFELVRIYRFDDEVYKDFKQVALICKRRNKQGFMEGYYSQIKKKLEFLENLPYIPAADADIPDDDIFVAPATEDKNVEVFASTTFDPETAVTCLSESPLYERFEELTKINEYKAINLGNPPLPLKRDLLYLCAVSGGGQGIAGSEEASDLHLQRGVAKVVKEIGPTMNEDGEIIGETETTKTAISMYVVENSGTVTCLS